jgi:flagellin-like hook-associated protein FlgL
MSSDITLSKGVRQNLLSLQSTAELLNKTQERLSTGKKVNSALDNPINFFTSSGLSSRANDLSRLLDSVGNAVQTIAAADKGISAITKLIESAKATASQAKTAALGDATYDTTVTGNTAIVADTTRATSTDFSDAVTASTASVQSSYSFDYTAAVAAGADATTITFAFNGISVTFEDDRTGDGVASGNVGFDGTADLAAGFGTLLESYFGAANVGVVGDDITLTGDFENDFVVTYGGTNAAAVETASAEAEVASVDGDVLTLTQGSTTTEYRYVTAGATPAVNGTFTTLADLVTAIDALAGSIDATDTGGDTLRIEDAAGFTVGGEIGFNLGLNATGDTQAYADNYNTTLAGLTGILSVAVGDDAAQTINLGTVTTRAALSTALSGLSGVTASINGGNQIEITWTTAETVSITGTGTSASGLFAGANIGDNAAVVDAGGVSAARASLQTDFNELLAQVTQLARDASFNGINLLDGDNLTVTFNEDGSSTLAIAGVDFSATGLSLTSLVGTEFQTDGGVDTAIAELDAATATLRSQASKFGSNLSIVQTRQDFTKNLISVLQIGADQLVLADTNEEGANLLALNTRQQLSTTALSLAAQADQNVLRLF